jgi:ribosomal-protein-alanine N-acetyltransferase
MSGVRTQRSEEKDPERSKLDIRPLRLVDVDEVSLLERAIFPMPWPGQAFVHELKEGPTSFCLVARDGALLAGYLVAWFVYDEAHLGNLAVRPELRRRGVATRLMQRLIKEAEDRSVRRMTLEVRVSNIEAIRIYRGFGFRAISIRRGYYVDNREDAFVMLKQFAEFGSEPSAE